LSTVSESPIAISVVALPPEVEETVLSVLRSGTIAQGPMVKQLEDRFAELIGARHAVAVNNGTTALFAAVSVLDLQPGDEIVTSPFTFVATLNAIVASGATARFADISDDDFNIAPDALEAVIGAQTRVLMPVHLYGQCADMPVIARMASDHGIELIEDAAQAHDARVGDKAAGTWGTGCFSLYATKNLTSGEGGLITTSNDDVADRLRVLRNQGMRQRYQYEMVGNNFRMTDLQAAVCVPQLAHYAQQIATRQANAAHLSEGLRDMPGLRVPAQLPDRRHVWHQYTVLIEDDAPLTRDELLDELMQAGVGCGVYYPRLVYDYQCYKAHPQVIRGDVPVAERVVRQCLSLPVHAQLSSSDLDRIVTTVRRLLAA
jgi:dTDP-4-amino-4,6-dideoxygalactose transaminase